MSEQSLVGTGAKCGNTVFHSENPDLVSLLGLISRVIVKLWTFQSACMGPLERYGESEILVPPVPIFSKNKGKYFGIKCLSQKKIAMHLALNEHNMCLKFR